MEVTLTPLYLLALSFDWLCTTLMQAVNDGFCRFVCFSSIYLLSEATHVTRTPFLKLSNKINTSINQEILPSAPGDDFFHVGGGRFQVSTLWSAIESGTGSGKIITYHSCIRKCIKVSIPCSLTMLTLSISHSDAVNGFGKTVTTLSKFR